MTSPHPRFAKTVAVKSLELAVRFWPEESRHWGQALLAEAHEIAHPLEAFSWALGGVTVFLRSHLSNLFALLKLPPGRTTSPLPVGPNGPRFPHNSRLVTALILLAVAVLLLVPAGREAASIVTSSWRNFEPTPGDARIVERLAAQAEKNRDAHQLAFLANCEADPDRSEQLANRAVALDPSLFWIYAGRYRRPSDTVNQQWLDRLRTSDPDNAFVYILAAQAAVDPANWSRFGRNGPDATQASKIPGYSVWAADMGRAFQSSRYDSYTTRHRDLTRQGWSRVPEVPVSLAAYSLWSHLLPDVGLIRKYVDLQIRQADLAATDGRTQEAEQSLRQVASFAQRMIDGSETDFERIEALEISRRGQDSLRQFYARSGRQADEQAAIAQIRQLESDKNNLVRSGSKLRGDSWDYFRKRAIFVQISACATLILAAFTILSLTLLELPAVPLERLRLVRWITCRVADFGPAAVLVFASVFLLCFRPFAFALEQYRSTIPADSATPDFVWQLMTLSFMQPFMYLFQPSGQAALWLFLIFALSLIAAALVVRGIWRHATPAHRV